MKKLKLIFSMLLICSMLKAQNDWNESGNTGTNPASDYVGTTDNKDLSFGTYSTIKMQLEATGELGLGTTSPASWFHILTNTSGTVNAKEVFRTEVPNNTETNWTMYKSTTNMMRIYNPALGNAIYFQSLRGSMKFSSGYNGFTVAAMEISGGNNSNADGNVLIGDFISTSPSARLHIKGNGYQYLFKAVSSLSSNPVFAIEDGERLLFKVTNYSCTSNTDAAMKYEYFPSSGSSDANGVYFDMSGDFSNSANGFNINLTNSNSSSSFIEQAGITVSAINNNPNGNENYGLYTKANGLNSQNYGAYFNAGSQCNFTNIGLYCSAENAPSIYGLWVSAVNTSAASSKLNSYGIKSSAQGSANNYGVYGIANQDNINGYVIGVLGEAVSYGYGSTNYFYGVQGIAPLQTCTTGTCNGAAGYFNGDVYASNGIFKSSDLKLKDQIQPVLNASNLLSQINAKQFTFKTVSFPELNLPNGQHFGFIAQDIENILPNLVKGFVNPPRLDSTGNILYNSLDFKAVNYEEFIPLLVAGFNEQKARFDSLLNTIQNPAPIVNPQNSQKITLSNVSSIILNQNDPNPFTESTRITYQVPDDVHEAKIIFTNSTGSIINTVIINERGTGELEVYASDLSKGIYNYTLVCDGKIISTMKMVKQ